MIINRHCMDENCRAYELTVGAEELELLKHLAITGDVNNKSVEQAAEIQGQLDRAVRQCRQRGLLEPDGTCGLPVGSTDLPCVRDEKHEGDCNWKYRN